MSEFEGAIPEKEQDLKARTDATIDDIGDLPVEDLAEISGGHCSYYSDYACQSIQCDTVNVFDCAQNYEHQCSNVEK